MVGGGEQARGVVRAAAMGLGGVRRGDSVWLAGLSSGHTLVRRRSSVISATQATSIAHPKVPRFRAIHQEARPPPPLFKRLTAPSAGRVTFHIEAFSPCGAQPAALALGCAGGRQPSPLQACD